MSEEQIDDSIDTPAPPEDGGKADDVVEETSNEDTGETTPEGDVPDPTDAPTDKVGQAVTTLDAMAEKFGWTKENAAEEAAKMAQGLESKLGNRKDIEASAAAYDKLKPMLDDPRMQAALGLANKEEEFIDADHTPEEIIDHRVDMKVNKMFKEKIEPMQKTFYGDKAKAAIDSAREQFPDFDNYKEEINARLEKTPWLIGDEQTLVDIYKVLTYDKAKDSGGKAAVDLLKEKKNISLGSSGGSDKTQNKGKQTVREALNAAWGT